MQYFGELISIAVAVSWMFTALFFEFAGRRIGSLSVNLLRLVFAFFLLGGMLYFTTGSMLPVAADGKTWFWMSLSGLVGFVLGDMCLFYSYIIITARFSQLLMTLAPPFAALFGWMLIGEKMSPMGFLGMTVTLTGIAISILKRNSKRTEQQETTSSPQPIQETKESSQSIQEPKSSSQSIQETTSSQQSQQNGEGTLIAGASNLTVVTCCEKDKKNGFIKRLNPNLSLHLPLKGVLLGIGGALGQGLGIVLSKHGMNFYSESAAGTDAAQYIPFAATQIRIITGVIGFTLIILLTGRGKIFMKGIRDKNANLAILGGAFFGPFLGVSLSLMAVQHTNTAIASTIMATTPIIILIPYVLFYKKKITWIELAGAILSVGGVALFFL
jgi:drug/metabolite transporter (DMT)-like permease